MMAFTQLETAKTDPPFTGAGWAARAELYAALIAEHLSPQTAWLDAGCGWRLLEDDLDSLEDWLVRACRLVIGMDVSVGGHRNVHRLVEASLYEMPFVACSLDLVTCNMVVEHLDHPNRAFAEIARCLRPRGALIIHTPNLNNYGIMGNAIISKVFPEKWRRRLIYGTDDRKPEEFFPVRYRANRMNQLLRLLEGSGFEPHRFRTVRQQEPFFRKTKNLERFLMKLTPYSGLLVCAHKLP
jgi:SAM-dependent methyltransferase